MKIIMMKNNIFFIFLYMMGLFVVISSSNALAAGDDNDTSNREQLGQLGSETEKAIRKLESDKRMDLIFSKNNNNNNNNDYIIDGKIWSLVIPSEMTLFAKGPSILALKTLMKKNGKEIHFKTKEAATATYLNEALMDTINAMDVKFRGTDSGKSVITQQMTWKNLLNQGQWKATWPEIQKAEQSVNVLVLQYLLLENKYLELQFFENNSQVDLPELINNEEEEQNEELVVNDDNQKEEKAEDAEDAEDAEEEGTIKQIDYASVFDDNIRMQRLSPGMKLQYAITRFQFKYGLPVSGITDKVTWEYMLPKVIPFDTPLFGYTVIALLELLRLNSNLSGRPDEWDPFLMDEYLQGDITRFNRRCGISSNDDANIYRETWQALINGNCNRREGSWREIGNYEKINNHANEYNLVVKYILHDYGFMNTGINSKPLEFFIENQKNNENMKCPKYFNEATATDILKAIVNNKQNKNPHEIINDPNGILVLNKEIWEMLYHNVVIETTGNITGDHVEAAVALMTKHGLYSMMWSFAKSNIYSQTYISSMKKFQEKHSHLSLNINGLVDKPTWQLLITSEKDINEDIPFYYLTQESEDIRAACFLANYQIKQI